jgi:hypothetical protein
MYKIQISDELLKHCRNQVEQYNFGMRKEANGTKEQQFNGIVGQCVLMQLFNCGLVDGSRGFDNGIDIEFGNHKIDVKTMGRTTDVKFNYTNNFLKFQDYFDTTTYIFCSYNKITNELTICGWIDKETFIKRRNFFEKGSERTRNDGSKFTLFADLYEIDNINLFDVISTEDLKHQLSTLQLKLNFDF